MSGICRGTFKVIKSGSTAHLRWRHRSARQKSDLHLAMGQHLHMMNESHNNMKLAAARGSPPAHLGQAMQAFKHTHSCKGTPELY